MPESTNELSEGTPPEPERIRETMTPEVYEMIVVQERRDRAIRFLLSLLPTGLVPGDANARIEQLLNRWKEDQKKFQPTLEGQLRQLLNLGPGASITDEMIPSVEEVRFQIDQQIPYDDRLSDLVITMREE